MFIEKRAAPARTEEFGRGGTLALSRQAAERELEADLLCFSCQGGGVPRQHCLGRDGLRTRSREPLVDKGVQVIIADGAAARHFTLLRMGARPVSR